MAGSAPSPDIGCRVRAVERRERRPKATLSWKIWWTIARVGDRSEGQAVTVRRLRICVTPNSARPTAKSPLAIPVVVLMPPEPVAGSPPGGVTTCATTTVNEAVTPLVTPVAVPLYVPAAPGAGSDATAVPSPAHVADVVADPSTNVTVSPGVHPDITTVTVPPGAVLVGLTVAVPPTVLYWASATIPKPRTTDESSDQSECNLLHGVPSGNLSADATG